MLIESPLYTVGVTVLFLQDNGSLAIVYKLGTIESRDTVDSRIIVGKEERGILHSERFKKQLGHNLGKAAKLTTRPLVNNLEHPA
jgi:hypothetical protein